MSEETERHITLEEMTRLFGQQDRRRLLYGEWLAETEQERQLRELAEVYHTGCEAYDRRVCSGYSNRTHDAMPMTPVELHLVNRHAREMRDEVIRMGKRQGLSEKQVIAAIQHYAR